MGRGWSQLRPRQWCGLQPARLRLRPRTATAGGARPGPTGQGWRARPWPRCRWHGCLRQLPAGTATAMADAGRAIKPTLLAASAAPMGMPCRCHGSGVRLLCCGLQQLFAGHGAVSLQRCHHGPHLCQTGSSAARGSSCTAPWPCRLRCQRLVLRRPCAAGRASGVAVLALGRRGRGSGVVRKPSRRLPPAGGLGGFIWLWFWFWLAVPLP